MSIFTICFNKMRVVFLYIGKAECWLKRAQWGVGLGLTTRTMAALIVGLFLQTSTSGLFDTTTTTTTHLQDMLLCLSLVSLYGSQNSFQLFKENMVVYVQTLGSTRGTCVNQTLSEVMCFQECVIGKRKQVFADVVPCRSLKDIIIAFRCISPHFWIFTVDYQASCLNRSPRLLSV